MRCFKPVVSVQYYWTIFFKTDETSDIALSNTKCSLSQNGRVVNGCNIFKFLRATLLLESRCSYFILAVSIQRQWAPPPQGKDPLGGIDAIVLYCPNTRQQSNNEIHCYNLNEFFLLAIDSTTSLRDEWTFHFTLRVSFFSLPFVVLSAAISMRNSAFQVKRPDQSTRMPDFLHCDQKRYWMSAVSSCTDEQTHTHKKKK